MDNSKTEELNVMLLMIMIRLFLKNHTEDTTLLEPNLDMQNMKELTKQ